jgi:hypothetical protein
MPSNNDVLLIITNDSGVLTNAPLGFPQWFRLYSIDPTGASTEVTSVPSSFTSTDMAGIYRIGVKEEPFYNTVTNSFYPNRFTGVINCGTGTSPQFQPFDFRPEDFDDSGSTISNTVSGLSANLTALSTELTAVKTSVGSDATTVQVKLNNIQSAVANPNVKKYVFSGRKPNTQDPAVSWVSSDQNSKFPPEDTSSGDYLELTLKGYYI